MINIKIYLDDNLDNDEMIIFLQVNGFEVISPRKIGMSRKQDEEHLKCAILNNSVILTYDHGFTRLHNKFSNHSGIIIIFRQNNPKKEMTRTLIVRALKNIIDLNLELKNKIYKLNNFNY